MSQKTGVFSQSDLEKLFDNQRLIGCGRFSQNHIGTASVDITVTDEAYRVTNLLQPRQVKNQQIRNFLPFMRPERVELGSVIGVGETVIAKGSVGVNFPPGMYGYLNAKSSSGRNFLFTRSLADGLTEFDSVDKRNVGYTAEIWLVLQPLVFPIILTDQERYNQLRVFDGDTRFKQEDLNLLLQEHDLLFKRDTQEAYKQNELSLFTHDGSIFSTLYAPAGKLIGYRCKRNVHPIDLTRRDIDPKEYFEPVHGEYVVIGDERIEFVTVEAGYHYLLSTNEMLKVPDTHTAELVALNPRLGFFFSHFAGFFDNGFFGTATLEIYAPITVRLHHKQPVAQFVFEELRSPAPSYNEKGNYQGQIQTQLPKQFLPWKE
jgi:deoxycytidine triphosphate deaminase